MSLQNKGWIVGYHAVCVWFLRNWRYKKAQKLVDQFSMQSFKVWISSMDHFYFHYFRTKGLILLIGINPGHWISGRFWFWVQKRMNFVKSGAWPQIKITFDPTSSHYLNFTHFSALLFALPLLLIELKEVKIRESLRSGSLSGVLNTGRTLIFLVIKSANLWSLEVLPACHSVVIKVFLLFNNLVLFYVCAFLVDLFRLNKIFDIIFGE